MSAPQPPRMRGLASRNGSAGHGEAPRRGVLLLNLGTPDAPDTASVRRYLREFLADPYVIKLPRLLRWMNRPLAMLIAQFRGPASAHAYRSIWTDRGSPLKVITEDQVTALEAGLPKGWRVFGAMRYGTPSVDATLHQIVEQGIEELVVVPMYPQYSGPTTGTAVADLFGALKRCGPHLNIKLRNTWYDDAGYIEAQARLLRDTIESADLTPSDTVLVFSAHSMPKSYVEAGDPYQEHVLCSVDLIVERLGWPTDRVQVAYQSKLGPVPWLEPSTEDSLKELADAGEHNVLVCPISFTADCLESLEEIDIRYRENFEAARGRLHVCPALNTYEPFIKSLTSLVLRGPRPMSNRSARQQPPLLHFEEAEDPPRLGLESLVMLGVSQTPRLGNGHGPRLRHATLEQFQHIKRPHQEVATLLKQVSGMEGIHECWLWNTCSRFELYCWLSVAPRSSEADQLLARLQSMVFEEDAPVNLLAGRDAWHHLLRTAAGLNSGLPGDDEILSQLVVAQRVAERCETAGHLTEHLLDSVKRCQAGLSRRTDWAIFRSEYCPVAMQRVFADEDINWDQVRCVVIGGSTTARSILNALRERLRVPARHLTAVYRSQSRGTTLKQIREAVGAGSRLRVDNYHDPRVHKAIAQADIVFFAVDARQAILAADDLAADRDFQQRPMTILDFNTFGSTADLEDMPGLHLIEAAELEAQVRQFANTLCECPAFVAAREQAEAWLRDSLEEADCDACCAAESPAPACTAPEEPERCRTCSNRHSNRDCPFRLFSGRTG